MARVPKGRLVAVPGLIALAVTLLRLIGELRGWSPTLFGRGAGGLGALVGIIWLAPLFGVYFALRLLKLGAGPASPRKAVVHALWGVGLFMAFGLITFLLWPPYRVQVMTTAAVALGIVILQVRGWPALCQVLLFYALASRVPVAIVMLFAILGSWGTHYDAFPPGFPLVDPLEKWLWGGLAVQMTVWVGITVLLGAFFGSITAAVVLKRQGLNAVVEGRLKMRRVIEMSRRGKAIALVAVLCAGGCYESDFPLDSAPQVTVDAALLGTWRCLSFDADPQERPATVVVESPREHVYGVTLQEDGKGPEHYEAHASSVRIPRLLNIQELKDGVDSRPWVFARYTFLRPQVFQLQIVSDKALNKVEKSRPAVRDAIERLRASPSLFDDFCVCVRTKDGT
jgi:hypothetical protein